ncbi:MAG: 50S ribosomal protein L25 [Chitinivibrionales bacterium]|nr:50S ribosomal protein L25 [Chitinivibrionales bacterium]
MSLNIEKLTTRPRETRGKSSVRKSRQEGWIPGVFYGHGRETRNIEVDAREFASLARARKASHLIDLGLKDEKDSVAIIKEIQRDPLIPADVYHLDFQHVSMDEKVRVDIAVEIVGTPVGVQEQDGILGNPVKMVAVNCLPMSIPEKVSVDVSGLHIGEAIHVSDLSLADDVEILNSPEEVVANVTRPTKPKEEEVETEEGVEEGADEGAGEEKESGEKKESQKASE